MKKRKKTPKSEVISSKGKRQDVDENSWREPLEAISINDEEWWCIVTMMVETITEHSRCVSLFTAAAEEGRRKAICSVSCQKTLASVKALSKQSLDKCPVIQGVCHYASKVLNEDNDSLPSWLMARIIKYFIYRAREESIGIVKRLADLEREIDEEYWIMQTVADWGQPSSKKLDTEKFNHKANTKLRKRGEEWRDTVYVDDAPLNGPNLYIILTGFHDPDLPQDLINAGVPLSCILQIKRPCEKLDRLLQNETFRRESSEFRKLQFLEEYSVNKVKLYNFWTKVRERSMDLEKYPEYCEIGFLIFCPPGYPATSDNEEYEAQKKDTYDRVSYIVYDFYDTYRQHGNYLKSMKVERAIADESAEKVGTEAYESLLDAFPLECVSVPLVLFAMLVQVEANEKRILDENTENAVNEKGDAKEESIEKNEVETQTEAAAPSQSSVSFVEARVKTLNVKFDLDDEEYSADNGGQRETDIDLILHGDILQEAIRFLDDSAITGFLGAEWTADDLMGSILPIFQHPIIAKLGRNCEVTEKKLTEYSRHFDNVRQYFDTRISNEEIRHYLHSLVFDKMIFLSSQPEKAATSQEDAMQFEGLMGAERSSTLFTKRCKSLPSLASKSTPEIRLLSDGNIDYGKMVPEITEFSPLFDLIDPRELLVPGYLERYVFGARVAENVRLEDFSDVELLSRAIFLQLLHECLIGFDRVEIRYFEPTDSLLLCFGNKWRVNGVSEEERMSSIRTPVRLRDFCKYVASEEKDWLRQEEELYRLQTVRSMERLMRKSSEMYEETMLFRDEDFILAGTLKAKDLEKRGLLEREKNTLEADIPSDSSAEETVKSKEKGGKKSPKKKKGGDKSTDRKSTLKKSIVDEESPSAVKKTPLPYDVEEQPVYDFIGYDLGRLRVQITNFKKTFYSADNTLVRVEVDEWLYKVKNLRIAVTLNGYTLRMSQRIGSFDAKQIFHLTSRIGIVLAFQKPANFQHASKNLLNDWRDMSVEHRSSWPTGLIIEPVVGDGPQNPYYIQQRYVQKGYTNKNREKREVCRKFLRNGTILKYLEDGRVIVLRPNGIVVTCTEFKKPEVKESFDEQADISKNSSANSSGDRARETKSTFRNKKKRVNSLKPQLVAAEGDSAPAQQNSTTVNHNGDNVLSMADGTVEVSRYTVLNHDGGQYEVFNDLVVSEQHRLLVRMASDYEVDEKFTRRADGTNMLLNSNGELIVRFPDGTRITTGYRIEKNPVTCDWTEEEILRYFTSDGMKEEDEYQYVYPSSSNLRNIEEAASSFSSSSKPNNNSNAEYEERIAELLIADSFVSVLLTCRMEHKNYATVSYDQSAVSCTLSMPDDLRVSISGRGDYEVSMADGVNLKINKDNLSFKGIACTVCGSQSTSIYNFFSYSPPTVIFSTTDAFGNIFEVKHNGTTRFYPNNNYQAQNHKKSCPKLNKTADLNEEEGAEEEVSLESFCNHEMLLLKSNNNRNRIFAMNKDLTAYEYIHRVTRNQVELMAAFDEKMSTILYPSTRRPELHRLITWEPVLTESQAKAALSFPDYELKPTNYDRRAILRSTYSIPYDWLFPFGRKGNGIWENTHDFPLMSNVEALPELLRVRILRGFKDPKSNAVIDLQSALGRYWMSIVRGMFESPMAAEDSEKSIGEKVSTEYDSLEDDLKALALGLKNTIDVGMYKIGLERRWRVPKARLRRRSMKFDEFLGHKVVEKEELEWYKRCMREKFILPYFQNITGTCFLWVMDCMENALNVSVAESYYEIGESQKYRFFVRDESEYARQNLD